MKKIDFTKTGQPNINPIVALEAISTDYVTRTFFSNVKYRYYFYKNINELYKKYANEYLNGDLEEIKNHFYFIFKGGNVIKAVIDRSVENIHKYTNKELPLDNFSQQKRSDSDFSLVIDFNKTDEIAKKRNINPYKFKIKLLLIAEKITYNMLIEFRNNYNISDELYFDHRITNYSDNIQEIKILLNQYNVEYENLIKYNFDVPPVNSENYILYQEFINHEKNIITKIKKIYDKNNINIINFPKIKGIIVNEEIKDSSIGMENINDNNSISLNKLYEETSNINKTTNLTSKKKDMLIYYCDDNKKMIISDDFSYLKYIQTNNPDDFVGNLINLKNVSSQIIYNNIDKIVDTLGEKIPIKNIINISDGYKKNNLYVSSNNTLKFIQNISVATFNLVRMKHNIRLFFELPVKINNIKYFYVDVPGEWIDISIPTWTDKGLAEITHNVKENIKVRTFLNPENETEYFNFLTYSDKELIMDISAILYEYTKNKPWKSEKYEKRLERMFRLYFPVIIQELKNKVKSENIKESKIYDMILNMKTSIWKYMKTKNIEHLQLAFNNFKNVKISDYEFQNDIINMIFSPFVFLYLELKEQTKVSDKDVKELDNYIEKCYDFYTRIIDSIPENTKDLYMETNLIQPGGYHGKYLKYKIKYLKLKNKSNDNYYL